MNDLINKQSVFSRYVARLIQQANAMGYLVTLGEAYRPPQMAQIDAAEGKGIKDSEHTLRLAIDLNLFTQAGEMIPYIAEDYRKLGDWWKAQAAEGIVTCWGGDWGDCDHYSFAYNGRE